MTTTEAQKRIKDAGRFWEDFIAWMSGQTIGGTPSEPDWYADDVERFIRGANGFRY